MPRTGRLSEARLTAALLGFAAVNARGPRPPRLGLCRGVRRTTLPTAAAADGAPPIAGTAHTPLHSRRRERLARGLLHLPSAARALATYGGCGDPPEETCLRAEASGVATRVSRSAASLRAGEFGASLGAVSGP